MTDPGPSLPPAPGLPALREDFVPETARHLHAFDLAHAVMLTECGIVPPDIGAALLSGLLEMEREGVEAARSQAGGGHHAGERALSQRLGQETGGWLGIARSSADLGAVSFRMTARAALLDLMESVYLLREALIRLAERHAGDVVAGNSCGQHSQPTTFGHWALMFDSAMTRDSERLVALYGRLNRSPAGAGILAGSDLPINRLRTAELLGFEGLVENTFDAVLSHDLGMEFAAVTMVLAQTVARLADDLMLWSTPEYGLVRLPAWFCGTGSLMPQERNPPGLQHVRGGAAQALGTLTSVVAAERGPSGFPIAERREGEAGMRAVAAALTGRMPLLARALDGLEIDAPRAAALAGAHWSTATDLATLLVRRAGLDWRRAHGLAGAFVGECIARGLPPGQARAEDLARILAAAGVETPLGQDEVDDALDPAAFVRRRGTLGGPGPDGIAAGLVSATSRTRLGRSRLADRHAALARAERLLHEAALAIIGAPSAGPAK